jgi:hypothetical protein
MVARRLSRRGEHAAALAKCRGEDIEVLSRAGMHLSVLSAQSAPDLLKGIALAETGAIGSAFRLANGCLNNRAIHTLIGKLAVQRPRWVLNLVENRSRFKEISYFCEYQIGKLVSQHKLSELSPLLAVSIALKQGWIDLAEVHFNRLFNEHELAPPEVN